MAVARAKKVWLNDMIRDQPIDALPSSPLDSWKTACLWLHI